MKKPGRAGELPGFDPGGPADSAARRSWLADWRESWQSGQGLSASELLNRHPELAARSNSVLMLAYDEYCRRQASGESIDRSQFCGDFPAHEQSLARLLSVHEYLRDNSQLPTNLAAWETWPEAGEKVAGFELIDGLGLGAFARVFVAAEPAVAHRRVAVKVSVEGASEADILGKLSHPNIVQIFSVQQDEQLRWTLICMPYLGQATLDDVICQLFMSPGGRPRRAAQLLQAIEYLNRVGEPVASTPPDPWLAKRSYVEGVVHLMAQLADGLAHAHAKGICHRDLKPSNVLLGPGGKPMLLDFNLAQDEQVVGRLGGTLPYMAPEQLYATVLEPQAGSAKLDPRSDLFSLGVMAYELLCGSWPYGPILTGLAPDEFATELWERQRAGPTRLAERSPDIDPTVSSLIQRCLAFDPAERPQTAVELAAALRQCLSPAQRLRRWARAHRALVATATGVTAAVALAAACYIAALPPYAERELQRANVALASGDFGSASWHLEEARRSGLRAELNGEAADCYFRSGKLALQEKDYGQALEMFTRAANYGQQSWEQWFYRGAANYRTGKPGLANDDFAKAQSLFSTSVQFPAAKPQLMACRGDCAMRRRNASTAQAFYRAVLQQDYESVAVLNNLGLATILAGSPNGQHFIEAEKYLSLAIERAAKEFADDRDPRLQPLYYNRAVNEFKRCTDITNKEKCDWRAKRDIEIAIQCGPDNAWPYLMAAKIYGWMTTEGDPDWPVAVHFMEEAIKRGAAFDQPADHPFCGKLQEAVRNSPGFNELRRNRIREKMDDPPEQLDVLDEILDKKSP